MEKLLVVLLISSILLTQCYTQNEYLTKDYSFSEEDDLKKIVLSDSTERVFAKDEYIYEVESDSVLITSIPSAEKYGEHTRIFAVKDTLSREQIHSVFISELNVENTVGMSLIVITLLAAGKFLRVYGLSNLL